MKLLNDIFGLKVSKKSEGASHTITVDIGYFYLALAIYLIFF